MAEARVERRLAAILAADVAGYSRLMGVDEEGTLAALKTCRRELVDPKIAEHRGRIVKTTGDGVLVEFASAVDAVRCAIEIQCALAERNADIPEDRRIEFRIGINVGDIIIDEGDIYGDGVNIAARVEPLASPGAICISDNAYQQIKGKLAVDVSDMGEQQLKNIAQPIRTYGIRLDAAASRPALALSDKPSIAVLPFTNMSGDPEQEYFADGMVEDIITGLSRIKWLAVISRNSSFTYKGRAVDVKQVGRDLGIRYVLEGSVRKSANRVRITAQLIDATTDAHLWAGKYDRSLEDIFSIQDEITMCVIGAIEPSLRKAEIDRVKRQRPNNLDAYDLVLRALPLLPAEMPNNAAIAIPMLEDALKLEPNYAAAHAFLGWCFFVRYARLEQREEDRIAAIKHARAAIGHGNDDAMALAVAAFVIALGEHDTATALKIFDRALEYSNSNVFALSGSAITLAWMGKSELAVERAQRALQLSPLDPLNWRSNHALAIAYFHTRRYGDAADGARSAVDSNPSFSVARAVLTAALMRLGRVVEAKAMAQTVVECQPSFTIHGYSLTGTLDPTVFGPFAEAWREAGLPE
jgi:adenylate cyclase